MQSTSKGLTEEEKHHYAEYCRLAGEARALYREWDERLLPDKVKAPHYKRAAALQKQADEHKAAYIKLGAPDDLPSSRSR